ncbi:hypothetical protein ENC19_18650 [Verrucosispora sp. CWR15]|uniref:Uncharacterized protein n=1 Tax=Verrucosispora sioxanthis TaxID=2499994 RepID=A0A6M1L8H4_9ACTN|nr:hypothetical protein [Verrucosispora sioxanthis]NGM14533.1 hypothetical protein [Verrucosispora sioxanthis]
MQAGWHLEAGGGGADRRHLHGRGRRGRPTGSGGAWLFAGGHRTRRRHDEAVLARILGRPAQAGWRADRDVPATGRLVGDGRAVRLVAVDVVAVDPDGPLGLRLLTDGSGQVGVA